METQKTDLVIAAPAVIIPDYLKPIVSKYLNKREANTRALNDYDRAFGKYCAPGLLFGTKHNKSDSIENKGSIVVQITETAIDEILNWEGDLLRPKWQVRVHRDLGDKCRGLRMTHIRGCSYEIGKPNGLGPFWEMHAHAWQIWRQ